MRLSDQVTFAEIEAIRAIEESDHQCALCKTPYGRSSIPCANDPARRTT